jgi:hypothetical protein
MLVSAAKAGGGYSWSERNVAISTEALLLNSNIYSTPGLNEDGAIVKHRNLSQIIRGCAT